MHCFGRKPPDNSSSRGPNSAQCNDMKHCTTLHFLTVLADRERPTPRYSRKARNAAKLPAQASIVSVQALGSYSTSELVAGAQISNPWERRGTLSPGFPRRYGHRYRQICPTRTEPGNLFAMENRCEVCEGFRPGAEFGERYRVVEVKFDVRRVHLCVGHKRIAENSGVASFEDLRSLYGTGRRSYVPRRGDEVNVPSDKRRNRGRRATDR